MLALHKKLIEIADERHLDQDDVLEQNLYNVFNGLFGFVNDDVQGDIIHLNDFEEESLIQISEHLKQKGH